MIANIHEKNRWSLEMVSPLEPGIVCVDIDRMLKFYTDVLGLKLVADNEASPEVSTRLGTTPDGYRIIRLQTPHGERIKLVQPKTLLPEQAKVRKWIFARQGIAYITFVIRNVNEVMAHLKLREVKLVSSGPVEVRSGVYALFTQDPEGNCIEFVEYKDLTTYQSDILSTTVPTANSAES